MAAFRAILALVTGSAQAEFAGLFAGTPEHDEANGEAQAALLARTPLSRTGTPEEIAEAVRWLLRDASYVTGQVMRVDGGRMLAG